jgi:hypothetical protein
MAGVHRVFHDEVGRFEEEIVGFGGRVVVEAEPDRFAKGVGQLLG